MMKLSPPRIAVLFGILAVSVFDGWYLFSHRTQFVAADIKLMARAH